MYFFIKTIILIFIIKLIQDYMEKILNFINKYGLLLIFVMVTIMFFRTCGMNTKQNSHDRNVEVRLVKHDSLLFKIEEEIKISNEKAVIERQIEGLKNENRFIQATDRKIVDYDRQNQIEKEIKALEKSLEKYER